LCFDDLYKEDLIIPNASSIVLSDLDPINGKENEVIFNTNHNLSQTIRRKITGESRKLRGTFTYREELANISSTTRTEALEFSSSEMLRYALLKRESTTKEKMGRHVLSLVRMLIDIGNESIVVGEVRVQELMAHMSGNPMFYIPSLDDIGQAIGFTNMYISKTSEIFEIVMKLLLSLNTMSIAMVDNYSKVEKAVVGFSMLASRKLDFTNISANRASLSIFKEIISDKEIGYLLSNIYGLEENEVGSDNFGHDRSIRSRILVNPHLNGRLARIGFSFGSYGSSANLLMTKMIQPRNDRANMINQSNDAYYHKQVKRLVLFHDTALGEDPLFKENAMIKWLEQNIIVEIFGDISGGGLGNLRTVININKDIGLGPEAVYELGGMEFAKNPVAVLDLAIRTLDMTSVEYKDYFTFLTFMWEMLDPYRQNFMDFSPSKRAQTLDDIFFNGRTIPRISPNDTWKNNFSDSVWVATMNFFTKHHPAHGPQSVEGFLTNIKGFPNVMVQAGIGAPGPGVAPGARPSFDFAAPIHSNRVEVFDSIIMIDRDGFVVSSARERVPGTRGRERVPEEVLGTREHEKRTPGTRGRRHEKRRDPTPPERADHYGDHFKNLENLEDRTEKTSRGVLKTRQTKKFIEILSGLKNLTSVFRRNLSIIDSSFKNYPTGMEHFKQIVMTFPETVKRKAFHIYSGVIIGSIVLGEEGNGRSKLSSLYSESMSLQGVSIQQIFDSYDSIMANGLFIN
ncbi:hypothetical protein KAU11_07550, partial [Candidatus Babeliales bacterium]|nr:hypothetical protein [Candidatus Babeliales bacterium]